jgi:DNA repair exonuclease SbcCD ATPase subunit
MHNRTDLDAAIDARDEAHARLEAATRHTSASRQMHAEKQAVVNDLLAEEQRWVDRHSKKLASWIAAGSKGTAPVLVADVNAQAKLLAAQAALRSCTDTLAQFEAAEHAARQELDAAEQVVQAAELVIDTVHVRQLDARRTELLRELEQTTETIAVVLLDNPLAVPVEVGARCNEHVVLIGRARRCPLSGQNPSF